LYADAATVESVAAAVINTWYADPRCCRRSLLLLLSSQQRCYR
jgi:hypothetical protein